MDYIVDFYISKATYDISTDVVSYDWKNIENDFSLSDGSQIRYRKCVGLISKGSPKNIYTESYADEETIRISMPSEQNMTRNTTNITFTFIFKGENRNVLFQSFYDYVKNGLLVYCDSARGRAVVMYLNSEVSPSEDIYIGTTPYIEAEFKFNNITGGAEYVSNNNTISQAQIEAWATPIIKKSLS